MGRGVERKTVNNRRQVQILRIVVIYLGGILQGNSNVSCLLNFLLHFTNFSSKDNQNDFHFLNGLYLK
jgi:hypothetical protein